MIKKIKDSFTYVFSNWKYTALSLVIALIFIILNLIIPNYKILINNLNLFYPLIIGGLNSTHITSIINLILIGLLAGILVSMIIYKIKSIHILADKKTTSFGGMAIFLGTLVPACSACGFGLLTLLGYSGILIYLPFAGLELAWLSIILLIVAIIVISNQITNKTCKTKELKNLLNK